MVHHWLPWILERAAFESGERTSMRLVFPCLPYLPREVEPMFESQREAATGPTSLLSYEDLQQGRLVLRPAPEPDELLLLRGWMLSGPDYRTLDRLVASRGWQLVTCPEAYERCHFLPRWLDQLADCTPETCFPEQRAEVEALLARWGRAFVKDWVKSCTVDGPPIVSSWDELQGLREKMLLYRETIEGGLCFRQVEPFGAEHRLFVWKGQVHGCEAPSGALELGRRVATRIESPFYSVDVARRSDGAFRVVELGDGQVSDCKEWSPVQLLSLLVAG